MLIRYLKALLIGITRPRGLKSFGPGSSIRRPRHLAGRRAISFGARTAIGQFCRMEAIQSYAGRAYNPSIEIADDVYIGNYAQIFAIDRITIGTGCVLSEHVYITDNSHTLNPAAPGLIMQQPLESKGPVELGDHCFIGFGARILPGVTLGAHCVVGTNAVVTKSFPPLTMLAGIPAQAIKHFNLATSEWQPLAALRAKT
jgi:acetyltransferase-like isoleucine patch superfamily enzyme